MKMKKKGNENEVKMTMRWKLLNQDAKRGTQKKRERANTNTWNLAQNGQPWKGKGKEKRRPTENGTRPAEEGKTEAPEPTWHGANLQQPQHATGQTYLERGERKNTWNRDPWGTSYWHDASTTHARFVIRLKGPRLSSHNPLDGLRVQPPNYVHNWTSPTTIKRKKNHT